MKIISKFKDFYDYKVAKYGVDEKLVYTRKTYCEYFQVLIGNISNINIDYRISEDDFNKNLKNDIKPIDEKNIHKILFIGEKLIHLFSYDRNRLIRVNTDIPSDDIILNAPIFLIEYIGEYNDGTSRRQYFPPLYKFTYNPNLSQMGVYIDEDFIWQSLVEFLSNKRSEKEIAPEVSNENKILSKGFDLKTSFRPNMKKKHKGDIWR